MTPEELAQEHFELYEYYAKRMYGRLGSAKWDDQGKEEQAILISVAREILKRNGWFVDVKVDEGYL